MTRKNLTVQKTTSTSGSNPNPRPTNRRTSRIEVYILNTHGKNLKTLFDPNPQYATNWRSRIGVNEKKWQTSQISYSGPRILSALISSKVLEILIPFFSRQYQQQAWPFHLLGRQGGICSWCRGILFERLRRLCWRYGIVGIWHPWRMSLVLWQVSWACAYLVRGLGLG